VKLHYAIIITDSIDSYPEDDIRDACYAMMKLGNTFDVEKRYPRCFALQAKYFTAKLQKHLKLSFKNLIDPEILSSWNNWLIEMSQDPRNFPLAYGRSISILNDLNLEDQRVVYSSMMKQPGIAPWLIHMIGGIYNNKVGWKYRGGGFANTVSEEGWKKLHEHQELARRHFLRAYSLQPKLPEAPCEMMRIALTSGPQAGSPTEWFLRTVKICFDFRQAQYQNCWHWPKRVWTQSDLTR
jgi:hypothetical protein